MTPHSGPIAILALAGIALFPTRREPARVELTGLRFHPARLGVSPGDSVTWINRDIVPHTVTGPKGGPDSGEVPPGGSYTLIITAGMGGRFFCRYHPDMVLDLRVR